MRVPNKYNKELEEARKDAWAAVRATRATRSAWYAGAASAARAKELEYQIDRVLTELNKGN